ncbi:hypothetical protein [Alicyclobacillus fastidiosus]|uniref:Uncharacterized protein n=1 Tax=Alicyclobacillus fastidiosus TaxID=392011 RepID=A0ABV5AI22_9BACL|nr:hypothetical protein [Alicyclobacillus fastidiosus]WEH11529.1 hypothetical protein PYS47_10110 [Alicyclobacillus fastidiosus]
MTELAALVSVWVLSFVLNPQQLQSYAFAPHLLKHMIPVRLNWFLGTTSGRWEEE